VEDIKGILGGEGEGEARGGKKLGAETGICVVHKAPSRGFVGCGVDTLLPNVLMIEGLTVGCQGEPERCLIEKKKLFGLSRLQLEFEEFCLFWGW